MLISFLIDSRYGGPQMIHNHLKKNVFSNNKTIYFDKKNKKLNFLNLKQKYKFLYFLDIIFNIIIFLKNKKYFFKYKIFFVYSIFNIVPIIIGILLKKEIVWYILEKPNWYTAIILKILIKIYKIEIICISKSIAKILDLKKYDIYFPAIDRNFWINKKKKNYDIIQLTCVGNLNKIKNHIQLLDFLKKVNSKFSLSIIGKKLGTQKNYYNKILNKISEINVNKNNNIKIFQNKNSSFIKQKLQSTDIYILPSISEGMSVSLIEAMCMGCICAVSDLSNHSNIISSNKNGFVFSLNEQSFLKIYNKINNLSQKQKKKISLNARKSIEKIISKNLKFEIDLKNRFSLIQ